MPNYIYRCTVCEYKQVHELPMSFEPSINFHCPDCDVEDRMTRRIGRPEFPRVVGKVWAGDWFKKTYGHDIGEVATQRAQDKMEYDAAKLKLEKDGVNITHRSRQVGGKDRISVPDKKD